MTTLKLSDTEYRVLYCAVNFRAVYLSDWLSKQPLPNLHFLYEELAECREALRTVFGLTEEQLPVAVGFPGTGEAMELAEVSE